MSYMSGNCHSTPTDREESNSDLSGNKPSVKNLKKSEAVFSWFIKYLYRCLDSRDVKDDPFDTMVLKAHYNFTSHLLMTIFIFVTSSWFVEEPAICIDKSDRSRAPEEFLEICLTYPYVEFPLNNDRNRMVRRYALHYKWVHLACLVLSFIFKGVIIPQRIFSLKGHSKLLHQLCETKLSERFLVAKRYFLDNKGCHKRMYSKFLFVHLSALCINALAFIALDITFQNQYWDLPKNLFVKRDPTSFHDPFSLIFPPFVSCEITSVHHILVDRTKWFGCHFTLMEVYEKIFMIYWFWQVILALWTLVFILWNLPFSFFRRWKLNLLGYSSFNSFNPFKQCAKEISTDEIFSLMSMNTLLLGEDYAKLLSHVVGQKGLISEESFNLDDTIYQDPLDKSSPSHGTCSFKSFSPEEARVSPPPIGFESLVESPISAGEGFVHSSRSNHPPDTLSTSPYSSWKRSFSLEFDLNPNVNALTAFDAKLSSLTQYLRREGDFCHSASTSDLPSAPAWSSESYAGWVPPSTRGHIRKGGEKSVHFEQDQSADEDWDKETTWPADGACWTTTWPNYNDKKEKTQDFVSNTAPECTDWKAIYNVSSAKNFKTNSNDNWGDEENWDEEEPSRSPRKFAWL